MGDIADQMVEQAENNYGKSHSKRILKKNEYNGYDSTKYKRVTQLKIMVDTNDLYELISTMKKSGNYAKAIGLKKKYLLEEIV